MKTLAKLTVLFFCCFVPMGCESRSNERDPVSDQKFVAQAQKEIVGRTFVTTGQGTMQKSGDYRLCSPFIIVKTNDEKPVCVELDRTDPQFNTIVRGDIFVPELRDQKELAYLCDPWQCVRPRLISGPSVSGKIPPDNQ